MALTFQDMYTKAQRLARSNNPDVLLQLKQDINTGYHMFNQRLARYYSRKQQFTNLIANQQIYQQPIDSVRIGGMTVLVSNTYQPPVKEVRSEYQWRQITSYTYTTNWPAWYFVLGNDQFSLWPIPSQNVTNGLRYWYQPKDHDLSLDDTTSTVTGATVTVSNGSATVTASSGVFTAQMVGLSFQLTGVADLTWYDIVGQTSNTLTLKSAFIGLSGSGLSWRIGQTSIIPQEFQDAPMHYALGNFFSAAGNENRSLFHLGTADKPGMYYTMINQCLENYSSSTQSSVITDTEMYLNVWTVPPVPSP